MLLFVRPAVASELSIPGISWKVDAWEAREGSRESGGGRSGEERKKSLLVTHKFSFPPQRPRDTAKPENCYLERAKAD